MAENANTVTEIYRIMSNFAMNAILAQFPDKPSLLIHYDPLDFIDNVQTIDKLPCSCYTTVRDNKKQIELIYDNKPVFITTALETA